MAEFIKREKGETPDEFFEIMQSEEAAELIEEAKASVSQVFLNELELKLSKLDEREGVIEFEGPLSSHEVVLLAAHKQAKDIKEVRYKSWDNHPKKDTRTYYQKRLKEFERVHLFSIPEFILEMICFYDLVVLDGFSEPQNGFDELNDATLGLLHLPHSSFLIEIIDDLNIKDGPVGWSFPCIWFLFYFIPFVSRENSYTVGIAYDFKTQTFPETMQILDYPLEETGSYFDLLDGDIQEIIYTDLQDDFTEIGCFIVPYWYFQVLMTGFLNKYEMPSQRKNKYDSNQLEKVDCPSYIAKNINPDSDLFNFICRIIGYKNTKEESKTKELYDHYLKLKNSYFSTEGINDIFQLQGKEIDSSPEEILTLTEDLVSNFIVKKINVSCPFIAVKFAEYFLDFGNIEVKRFALSLLEAMPDDFCPPFIKKNTRMYIEALVTNTI